MKRSPIKRGKPLSRESKRLARGSKSLKRGGSLKRGSRMRQVGKRGRAIRKYLDGVRALVFEAQGHRCARCEKRKPLDLHHLLSRARGGSNDASNLAGLCRACHDEVTFGTPPDQAQWVRTRKAGAA